jgi:hypothetical protein
LTTPTPDLAVSAAAFVALGALLRLKYSMANRYTPIVLGIALGLGALAKSFLIPWSMVCLVTLAVATWRLSAALRAVTTASLMWAVIVVPWCILLSAHVGRPTFGETGRLAYAWAMDFQESPSNQAMPVAASTPAADSLLPGVGITPHAQGTNPVWYDPARWYGRQQIQWGITRTLRLFGMYLTEYVTAFAPLVVFLWLALLVADPEARRFAWQRGWIVAVPVLTALTAYALVLVATRYIAPFVIAGTLVMWLVLPWPSRLRPMWVLVALVLSCIAVIVAPNGVPVIASQASIFAAVLTAWVFRGGSRGRMVVIALLAAIVTRAFTEAGLPAGTLFALLWALAIAAVASGTIKRDQSLEFSRFIRTALAVTSAIVLGLAAGAKYFDSLFAVSAAAEYHVENLPYAIASDLRDHGITPGMRVAVIGSSFDAYWARAGRLQVVAGVPPALFANFWTMPPAQRDALFAEFAKAGVQAVVATSSPPNPNRADSTWTPTKFHAWIRMLQPAAGH